MEIGFEPDVSFYIASIASVVGKTDIDLSKDPPPDLVVEIDITNSSINKLKLFAQIGVPEVWRYSKELIIYRLESGIYIEVDESPSLPGLSAVSILDFIKQWGPGKRLELLRKIRKQARTLR